MQQFPFPMIYLNFFQFPRVKFKFGVKRANIKMATTPKNLSNDVCQITPRLLTFSNNTVSIRSISIAHQELVMTCFLSDKTMHLFEEPFFERIITRVKS
jgi:hypothetical protein